MLIDNESGITHIKFVNTEKDKILLVVQWPDGMVGRFAGFSLQGYPKYIRV